MTKDTPKSWTDAMGSEGVVTPPHPSVIRCPSWVWSKAPIINDFRHLKRNFMRLNVLVHSRSWLARAPFLPIVTCFGPGYVMYYQIIVCPNSKAVYSTWTEYKIIRVRVSARYPFGVWRSGQNVSSVLFWIIFVKFGTEFSLTSGKKTDFWACPEMAFSRSRC